jgi:hypothetical protein
MRREDGPYTVRPIVRRGQGELVDGLWFMLYFVPSEKILMPITDRLIAARDRISDLQGASALAQF